MKLASAAKNMFDGLNGLASVEQKNAWSDALTPRTQPETPNGLNAANIWTQPEKKPMGPGAQFAVSALDALSAGLDPEKHHYAMQERQMNAQASEQQAAQKLFGMGEMAHQLSLLPMEQRKQAFMQMAPGYGLTQEELAQYEPGDISDSALQGAMRAAAGVGFRPPQAQAPQREYIEFGGSLYEKGADGLEIAVEGAAPQRAIIKGADGFQYYQDTGERVLPGVEVPEQQMDPAQRAGLALKRQEFEHRKRVYEDEKAARELEQRQQARGTNIPDVQVLEGSPFWQVQGEAIQQQNAGARFYQANNPRFGLTDSPDATSQLPMRGDAYFQTYDRETAKVDADRLEAIRNEAADVQNRIGMAASEMRALLNDDVPLGPMAGPKAQMSGYGLGWVPGIPSPEHAAKTKAFQALSTQMTIGLTGQLKGAISEYEMRQIQQAIPNVAMGTNAASRILAIQERMNQRIVDYAKAADEWTRIYGGLSVTDGQSRTFSQVWSQYIEADVRNNGGILEPQEQSQNNDAPTVTDDSDYDRLESGMVFIDPEGNRRVKP